MLFQDFTSAREKFAATNFCKAAMRHVDIVKLKCLSRRVKPAYHLVLSMRAHNIEGTYSVLILNSTYFFDRQQVPPRMTAERIRSLFSYFTSNTALGSGS